MLADFTVALFHWFEDNYLPVKQYDSSFIRELAIHNEIHHARPRDILQYSVWINIRDPTIAGALIATLMYVSTSNFVFSLAFLTTVCITQPIHRFQHMVHQERPHFAHALFATGLFVSPETHREHHVVPTTHYGIVFSPMNYLYEKTGMWRGLEAAAMPFWGPPVPK